VPVWSDDRGKTYNSSLGVYKHGLDECSIAQAANGSLMLVARNCFSSNYKTCQMRRRRLGDSGAGAGAGGTGSKHLAASWSHDGGETWSALVNATDLITPVCQPSIISYQGPADTQPTIYASHPYSQVSRENGTILASDDSGATFKRHLNLGIPTTFGYTGQCRRFLPRRAPLSDP